MSAADRPQQYFSEQYIATSSIGKVGIDFGFIANQVVFVNDKTVNVYVSLDSSAGSTSGYALKANESLSLQGLAGGCAVATTTTSTANNIRVAAWRY